MARSEEIEKIQYQFCKFVLQMPSRAPNAAVSAELGRLPVLLTTQLRTLKYLSRLQLPSTGLPHYLSEAYKTVVEMNLPWMEDMQMSNVPMPTAVSGSRNQYLQSAQSAITTKLLKEWSDTLWKDSYNPSHTTKLRLYRLYKTSYSCEPYLMSIMNAQLRKTLCRFRTGCYPLRIETGRYQRPVPPPSAHTCELCANECVENEIHFLIECPKYANLRESLYRRVAAIDPTFILLPQFEKFIYLLSSGHPDTIHNVAVYLKQAELVRNSSLTTK